MVKNYVLMIVLLTILGTTACQSVEMPTPGGVNVQIFHQMGWNVSIVLTATKDSGLTSRFGAASKWLPLTDTGDQLIVNGTKRVGYYNLAERKLVFLEQINSYSVFTDSDYLYAVVRLSDGRTLYAFRMSAGGNLWFATEVEKTASAR